MLIKSTVKVSFPILSGAQEMRLEVLSGYLDDISDLEFECSSSDVVETLSRELGNGVGVILELREINHLQIEYADTHVWQTLQDHWNFVGWEIRAQEHEMFCYVSWGNELDHVLFLGWHDASVVNNELFSLDTATKPEFEGQLSFGCIEYLHGTVVLFTLSKACSQTLFISSPRHFRIEMTKNLLHLLSCIKTSKNKSQHRLFPGGR